jgi:predicted RNA-binding protein Jag
MRDLVFSAATVSEAVAAAAAALGVEPGNLRYVAIEAGSPAVGMRSAVPARIAVLAEKRGPQAPQTSRTQSRPDDTASGPTLLRARLAELGDAISRASNEDIRFQLDEDDQALVIHVLAADDSALLSAEDGEAFRAIEHLLRRIALQTTDAQRVVISNPACQARRETVLQQTAAKLAEAVLDDGVPRVMERLNSYERRLVHMALTDVAGIRTRSEGAGDARLLVIEPASAPPTADGD